MTPQPALGDRPKCVRGAKGRFLKGYGGRPKGIKDRRTRVNMELLKAIAERHFPRTLERLLRSKSERIRFESIRWVGEMILGRPRQSLEVGGGLSDLAAELGAALAEVRSRRAALPAVVSGERGVNGNGEIPRPIEALRHTAGMREALPALPPAVLEASPEPAGASIVAGIAEAAPADDRAVAADAGEGGDAVDDPGFGGAPLPKEVGR
jgi:hypothetical protein